MDLKTLKEHKAFKKDILDVVFTHCETFYIHCMPADELKIGTRGLIDQEPKDGIILVFGPHSNRDLSWDEDFIFCKLQFTKWENIQIPYECISRVFDKSGQVIIQWATISKNDVEVKITEPGIKAGEHNKCDSKKEDPESKVIEVDFTKKRDT